MRISYTSIYVLVYIDICMYAVPTYVYLFVYLFIRPFVCKAAATCFDNFLFNSFY